MANKKKEKIYTSECVICVHTKEVDYYGTFVSWLNGEDGFILKMRTKTEDGEFDFKRIKAADILDAYMGVPHKNGK